MKIDVLYPFQYQDDEIYSAINRLFCSINSIINQDVNICICNTSETDIWKYIKNIKGLRYFHCPIDTYPYCKTKTINIGVKKLVKTSYFLLSDIDLVYPPDYIEILFNKYKTMMSLMPIRVVTSVYNINKTLISNNFQDYVNEVNLENQNKKFRDTQRIRFDISSGNGLIHRNTFMYIRGYDEDIKRYSGEDELFNLRISFLNKYIEDLQFNLRTIHIFHPIEYDIKDLIFQLNNKICKGRINYLQRKFIHNKFKIKEHIKDIIANQNQKNWEEI